MEVASQASPETQWKTVVSHQLFNSINNFVSQLIVDFRPKEEFDAIHITKSHWIPAESEDASLSSVVEALKSRHERTNYLELVVLFPSPDGNPELLAKIAQLIPANGGIITKSSSDQVDMTGFSYRCSLTCLVNSNEFFTRYQNCNYFLDGGQFPVRTRSSLDVYANEIIPNFMYLGDCGNAAKITHHQTLGITHIVDASNTRVSKSVAQSNNIEYLEIKIRDSESAMIGDHFETVHNFIETARLAGGKVLVHCMAGISRSSSLVLSYLVKYQNMSLRDAVTMVVTERPVVCPNEGFQAQLIVQEATHRNENSIADPAAFTALIQEVAKMWSQSNVAESEFDKLSIESWRQQQEQKMAYLHEGDPSNTESLPPATAGEAEGGGGGGGEGNNTGEAAKPPKNFLKRGEGKRATSRSGTRRPRPAPSAQPVEKPNFSAYVEKLRTTVADSTQDDVMILTPGNSVPSSVNNSMNVDASGMGVDMSAMVAEAVAEAAAEQQLQQSQQPQQQETVVADGVAAVEA